MVDVLEREGRGLNLTEEVRDGILNHTGPTDPLTLEGRIVKLVDRVAYINHDIDDAVRAGVLGPDELPREEIEMLGATGARRIDTLVHDIVETSADGGRHPPERRDRRGDALAPRASCSSACISATRRGTTATRAKAVVRKIFGHLIGRGDPMQDAVDYVAGMTDRFALRVRRGAIRSKQCRGSRPESVEAVKAAIDMVELVGGRTQLQARGRPLHRALPVPRGADAELLRQPAGQALLLLRLRRGRRCDHLRAGDGAARLRPARRVARRSLPRPARVRGGVARADDKRRRDASGSLRCSSARRASTSASSGTRTRARRRVSTSSRAGSARRSAASSGSGSRRAAATLARGALQGGLHARGARRRGARQPPRERLLQRPPRLPARRCARARSAASRRAGSATTTRSPAKYVNSPESELFRKGDLLYGLDKARRAIAKQDRAVVVEGNTDVIALRQAGFEPVVASMGTALTESQLRELSRLTPALYLCFDSDAAGAGRDAARHGACAKRGFEVYVVALPPGNDPADDPRRLPGAARVAEPYALHRVELELTRMEDRQHAYLRDPGVPERPRPNRPSGRKRGGSPTTGSA